MDSERMTFRGFGGEQDHGHLMDYLRGTLGHSLDGFLATERYHLDLKVHHENLHNNPRRHLFVCEAIIRIEGVKKPLVVKKSNANFYKAALACDEALRNILIRRARVRESGRRQKEIPISA